MNKESQEVKKDIKSFFEYDKQELFAVLLDLLGVSERSAKNTVCSITRRAGLCSGR